MSDPNTLPHEVETFADLPIQPTGSGPADLEMAYEQMRLADGSEAEPGQGDTLPATDAAIPTDDGFEAAESSAHPS